jgi:hypothetical protein
MRRIQVVMDRELDEWLTREANARRMSKSALIRWCVREAWEEQPYDNGLTKLLGMFPDAEPVDDIDEFLYGPLGPDA